MTNRGETLRTEDVWAAILGEPATGDVLPPLSRAELLSVIMAIVHRLPDAAERAVPDDPDSGPGDILSYQELGELLRAVSCLVEPALDEAAVRLFAQTLGARRIQPRTARSLLLAAVQAGPPWPEPETRAGRAGEARRE